jgi:O-antigen ligase
MSKVIASGLVLAIVFTTLSHGAVESWSVAGFGLLSVALLGLWGIKIIADKKIEVRLPATVWPLVALLVYGFFQSIEFNGQRTSLSMDVEATRAALPVLFFLIVGFLIAANFLNTPERLRSFVTFMIFFGFAVAVFAMIQNFTWNGKFYWFRPTSTGGFGPFVNRNHYAGFIEMLIPLPIALVLTRAVRKDLWLMYAFVAILMGISVVISLSRGGVISILASLVFISIVKVRRGKTLAKRGAASAHKVHTPSLWLKRAVGITAIAGILVGGTFWLGAEPFLSRVANSIDQAKASGAAENFMNREWIWRNTWAMIGEHKVFGVGLGAYETAFPAYRISNAEEIVTHTHNDYLQILADGGLIGSAIAVWFLALLFRDIWQSSQAKDPWLAAAALGGGASIFAMLIHSLFDFNLQIPSNALVFLILCAIVSHIAFVSRNVGSALEKPAPIDLAQVA